ncbi:hypothetical protein FQA39_LY18091 [Lamprigera yunnana]|nr:hypothetical protein FQA39_LY18091 [Lamprigera yunnana]
MCKMASRARRILRLAAEKLQSESSSSNANDNRKIDHSINDITDNVNEDHIKSSYKTKSGTQMSTKHMEMINTSSGTTSKYTSGEDSLSDFNNDDSFEYKDYKVETSSASEESVNSEINNRTLTSNATLKWQLILQKIHGPTLTTIITANLIVFEKQNLFDRYGLFMVGSTMSGLGTKNSDLDMCLLLHSCSTDARADAVHYLDVIRSSLLNCDFVQAPEVIYAKVPILKFKTIQHGFEVDLNCNNAVGIRNTHLLHCYSQLDWRVRPLIVVVKLWAQANGINDAKNMTISSYSLALMVIHFLQCGVIPPVIPCLHGLYPDKFNPEKEIHDIDIQEEVPAFVSDNKQTLAELLQGFLYYYATFNYDMYAISVRVASRVHIDECRYARSLKNDPYQWKYLCIEEPFDLTNTARSVYSLPTFKRIQRVFQVSSNILIETKNLGCILTTTHKHRRSCTKFIY